MHPEEYKYVEIDVIFAYVALLRGINVGGKNKLPMQDLITLFRDSGCSAVQTYIQSGNVLFTADSAASAGLPSMITAKIAEQWGYDIPITLRTADQLRTVVDRNPFLDSGKNEEMLHVLFLANFPEMSRLTTLDPERSLPDRFYVSGQEIYLYLPHGAGRTKLVNSYFDTKLATVSTGRNWRTVTKLLALIDDLQNSCAVGATLARKDN